MLASIVASASSRRASALSMPNFSTDLLQQVCDAMHTADGTLSGHLRTVSNMVDDFYNPELGRQQIVQHLVPAMVKSSALRGNGMAYRQALLLCAKIVNRENSNEIVAVDGFIPFVQSALTSTHLSITRPARDIIMKVVAHSPEPSVVFNHNDIDVDHIVKTAVEFLSPAANDVQKLDAIRVITLANEHAPFSADLQLCERLVDTFYNNGMPFVSKQSAGLILVFVGEDEVAKSSISQLLSEQSRTQPDRPMMAARCWQEVKDVLALVC